MSFSILYYCMHMQCMLTLNLHHHPYIYGGLFPKKQIWMPMKFWCLRMKTVFLLCKIFISKPVPCTHDLQEKRKKGKKKKKKKGRFVSFLHSFGNMCWAIILTTPITTWFVQLFFLLLIKYNSMLYLLDCICGVFFLGDLKKPPGHGPGQPARSEQ